MTCYEYQEQASQYIDGEMKDEDAGEFFMHLGACIDCRSFLRGSLELRSKIHDDILKANVMISEQPARPGNRLNLSFTAATALATVIVVATFLASIALQSSDAGNNPEPKVVYVMTLPTIEVEGVYPVNNQ